MARQTGRAAARVMRESWSWGTRMDAQIAAIGPRSAARTTFGFPIEFPPQTLMRRSHRADALHAQGVDEYRGGRRAEAVDLLRRALGLDPANANAHFNLGVMLSGWARSEAAVEPEASHRVYAHVRRGVVVTLLGAS